MTSKGVSKKSKGKSKKAVLDVAFFLEKVKKHVVVRIEKTVIIKWVIFLLGSAFFTF
jgi:hypothetical protein